MSHRALSSRGDSSGELDALLRDAVIACARASLTPSGDPPCRDEGFHLLVVSQFDAGLAARGVTSWLSTMDANGWIAREQILGPEARSRVPREFQLQRPDIANPPTILLPALALAVDALCAGGGGAAPAAERPTVAVTVSDEGGVTSSDSGTSSPWNETRRAAFCARHYISAAAPVDVRASVPAAGAAVDACRYACLPAGGHKDDSSRTTGGASPADIYSAVADAFPRLLAHYKWLQLTQAGRRQGSFRWRGATVNHNFASGLDDYPRGIAPTEDDENVDLLAWLGMAAHVLGDLGALVGAGPEAVQALASDASAAESRLVSEHWDQSKRAFCDIGSLRRRVSAVIAADDTETSEDAASEDPSYVMGHVCHLGYVSLLPLALRLLPPDSPQLSALLSAAADRRTLLTPQGLLRSLSKSDALYGTLENYWRGAAWINMNWLVAEALKYYGTVEGPHRARAAAQGAALRQAIVDAVTVEYARSGFIWESYDAKTGHGRGTHPFTGWSALVTLAQAARHPF